jgi:hypothetical protein
VTAGLSSRGTKSNAVSGTIALGGGSVDDKEVDRDDDEELMLSGSGGTWPVKARVRASLV